MVIKIRIV